MKIEYTQILPLILIIIDFAAAMVYSFKGDFWRVGYWIAAGALTICVTFGMKK